MDMKYHMAWHGKITCLKSKTKNVSNMCSQKLSVERGGVSRWKTTEHFHLWQVVEHLKVMEGIKQQPPYWKQNRSEVMQACVHVWVWEPVKGKESEMVRLGHIHAQSPILSFILQIWKHQEYSQQVECFWTRQIIWFWHKSTVLRQDKSKYWFSCRKFSYRLERSLPSGSPATVPSTAAQQSTGGSQKMSQRFCMALLSVKKSSRICISDGTFFTYR